MKIAQLILEKLEQIPTKVVEEIQQTTRESSGFDSTDKQNTVISKEIENERNTQSCLSKCQLQDIAEKKVNPIGIVMDVNGDAPDVDIILETKGRHKLLGLDLQQDD